MNSDDIIRLTKEAGWVKPNHVCNPWSVSVDELERFAALVAAAEREACAKMFDGEVWAYDYREIAAAIRARGEA